MGPIKCEACGHDIAAVCPADQRMHCRDTYRGIRCNGQRCLSCCVRERSTVLTRKKGGKEQ